MEVRDEDGRQHVRSQNATFGAGGDLTADLEALRSTLASNAFTLLPITVEHACATARLPWHHKDPFDRMLVAQAITEPLRLLTADAQLEPYSDLIRRV